MSWFMNNKEAAKELKDLVDCYKRIPRGNCKSYIPLLIKIMALSKAINVLEKTQDDPIDICDVFEMDYALDMEHAGGLYIEETLIIEKYGIEGLRALKVSGQLTPVKHLKGCRQIYKYTARGVD